MIQSVDAAISALLIVFGTIAILIIVLGLFMVVTGQDVVPNVFRTRLRRVPATARDQ